MLTSEVNVSAFNEEPVMKHRLDLIVVAVVALTDACQDPFKVAPGSWNWMSEQRVAAGPREITVMTQNLYVGADVDLVIRALGTPDPGDDFPALLSAIETVGKTDLPARAEAIADEIARTRPHAVGLQEASEINIDLRPLGVPAVVDQDFIALLQAALAAGGLNYTVSATSNNIHVNLS